MEITGSQVTYPIGPSHKLGNLKIFWNNMRGKPIRVYWTMRNGGKWWSSWSISKK